MTQTAYAKKIGMSKQYVNKLVKLGVIVLEGKKVNVAKADIALAEHRDPTRDAQRDANAEARGGDALFDEQNIPEHSLATMNDDERKKYDDELQSKLSGLESEAQLHGIEDMPSLNGSSKEWNTYKIKEQGLTYAIKRKQLSRELISISEAKGILEVFLNPISQAMEDLPYKLKAKFPNIDNGAIEWMIEYANNVKAETQNASF